MHRRVYLMNTQVNIFFIVIVITSIIAISACVGSIICIRIRFGILGIRNIKPSCIDTELYHIQQRLLMQVIRFSKSQRNAEIAFPFRFGIYFICQSLVCDITDIKILGSFFPYSLITCRIFGFLHSAGEFVYHLQ